MDPVPANESDARFVSYVALVTLVLAVAYPFLIAVLGGEEYAALAGIALLAVALVLGIASHRTLAGRVTLAGSAVLVLLVVVLAVLWSPMASGS
jgi:hypothetical protein